MGICLFFSKDDGRGGNWRTKKTKVLRGKEKAGAAPKAIFLFAHDTTNDRERKGVGATDGEKAPSSQG